MTHDGVRLGAGAEFDTIRDFVARWDGAARGIGDDAAIIDVPPGEKLVTSVDAFVENRHFRVEWITAHEVGYRAVTAALSDLAAMAARPLGILFAINVPDAWRALLPEIADGVGEAARMAVTHIVGGNVSGGRELSITTTVFGAVVQPLERRGARVGDRVYVTGTLGGPGAALDAWNQGGLPNPAHRARFARPVARIGEAHRIAAAGASAAIDISDGLVADAGHLAAASGASLHLALDLMPVMAGVTADQASRSGEEYELLFTAPMLSADALAAIGCPVTEIGEVVAGAGVTTTMNGRRVAAGPGHDHLST